MFIFAMCIKMAIDMKVLLLFFVCFMTYSCHSRNHSDSLEVSSVDTLFEVGNSLKLYLSDGVRPTSGYVRYYEENGSLIWCKEMRGKRPSEFMILSRESRWMKLY